MTDFLALLDRAIDDLASPETSRSSRGTGSGEGTTGTVKALMEKGVPVLPVLPVKRQEVWEDDAQNGADNSSQHGEARARRVSPQERELREVREVARIAAGLSVPVTVPVNEHSRELREVFSAECAALADTLRQGTVTDGEWSALTRNLLQSASEEDRDVYEERAAIIEFDAGLPRGEAERRAWREVFGHDG
jgi:hypothetical protein